MDWNLSTPRNPTKNDYDTLSRAYHNRLVEYQSLQETNTALIRREEAYQARINYLITECNRLKSEVRSQKGLKDQVTRLMKENTLLLGYRQKYDLLVAVSKRHLSFSRRMLKDMTALYYLVLTSVRARSFEPLHRALLLFKEYEPDNTQAYDSRILDGSR